MNILVQNYWVAAALSFMFVDLVTYISLTRTTELMVVLGLDVSPMILVESFEFVEKLNGRIDRFKDGQ